MSISNEGLVSQNEIINPGHGMSSGTDSIDLTFSANIAPSITGAGNALAIYIIYGWISLEEGPGVATVGEKDTGYSISDDVSNPGVGAPENQYAELFGGIVNQVYSGSTLGSPPYPTQGGQSIIIETVDCTWGFMSGDTITIQLNDTFDYIAAYAFLYSGDGIVPFYISDIPQFVKPEGGALDFGGTGTNGEIYFDSTYAGGDYTGGGPIGGLYGGLAYGMFYADFEFADGQQLLALTVLEGGEYLLGGDGGWTKPATLTQDTDDITDASGFWTSQVAKQIATGDCNVSSPFIYRIWSQVYPGDGTQGTSPIAEWESSPSRRSTDSDGVFGPGAGMFWVQIQDLFVAPTVSAISLDRIRFRAFQSGDA